MLNAAPLTEIGHQSPLRSPVARQSFFLIRWAFSMPLGATYRFKRMSPRQLLGLKMQRRAVLGLFAGLAGMHLSIATQAACATAQVKVIGTVEERAVAHEAIARVQAYFARMGFLPCLQLRICFKDRVELALQNGDRAAVLGRYDTVKNIVELARWTSPKPDQVPWGITWGRQMALSTATHEVVHAALEALLIGDTERLSYPWQEFIAYAVQFEVMDHEMRAQILEKYKDVERFSSAANINAITYGMDPTLFGLRSYLFAQEYGGSEFLAHLISGEVSFGTGEASPLGP